MKIFKKITTIFLILSIFISFSNTIFAKEIKESSIVAKVIQVIDGDSIKVELISKEIAYIKLKGIDAKGFDGSYQYLTNQLLGGNVTLIKDGASYKNGKFNYMIVYHNGVNINNQLVLNGFAVIDKTQDKGTNYSLLSSSENTAKENSLGLWLYDSDTYSSITNSSGNSLITTTDKININTATNSQLQSLLKNVSSELAYEIVVYRQKNPFSNIQEIKFVKDFDKKIYDLNKHALTVSTNINKATFFELKTLNNLSDIYINKIMDKRANDEFVYINQLRDILPLDEYDKIYEFASIKNETNIDISRGYSRANISLSDNPNLRNAGALYGFSENIVENRKNGYTYKTLMELNKLGIGNISEQDIHFLEDNLNVFTNINTKNIEELNSIFGITYAKEIFNSNISQKENIKQIIGNELYNKSKDSIYVTKNYDEYININTATKEQMQAQGLTTDEIFKIMEKRPIIHSGQLPINVTNINNKISLYTNINTASQLELLSLDSTISKDLADKIIHYQTTDSFGSLQEVSEFFKVNNTTSIYEKIKHYIVIR